MRRKSTIGPDLPDSGAPDRRYRRNGQRRHRLKRRQQQIEAQIASIEAQEREVQRKREIRANIIIGAVMRSHAMLHRAFVPALTGILDVGVRRPADRELLASVLGMPKLARSAETVLSRRTLRDAAAELTVRHGRAVAP